MKELVINKLLEQIFLEITPTRNDNLVHYFKLVFKKINHPNYYFMFFRCSYTTNTLKDERKKNLEYFI